MTDAVLVVHAAATWALVGLIWTIQLVHYPLFALVGDDEFPTYEAAHQTRITWLVAVLMPVEAVASVYLVFADEVATGWAVVGLVLVGVVWLSTGFWQGPMHPRLRAGFEPALHDRLVRTNWVRTAAWTARGVVAMVLISL